MRSSFCFAARSFERRSCSLRACSSSTQMASSSSIVTRMEVVSFDKIGHSLNAVGGAGGRLGRGQIDHGFDRLHRGDEEEDEQEEHDIDHRGHVDEVFVLDPARHEEQRMIVDGSGLGFAGGCLCWRRLRRSGTVTRPRQFGQVFSLPAEVSATDSFLPQ